MTAGPTFPLAANVSANEVRGGGRVDAALCAIPGVMTSMLAAFDANGIRTVEDLAACATDDLVGWVEHSREGVTRHPGILGGMPLSRQECDALILHARVCAGWIEPAASAP